MLATLIGPIMSILTRIIPDPAQQAEAKAELMNIMIKAQAEEMKAKSQVVIAEAKGESWMQRNWRPVLMFTFIVLIINNFILVPYMIAIGVPVPALALPAEMWTLLTIGVGGYIAGRSGEKIVKEQALNKQKFYDSLRDDMGGLSQEDVERLERAIKNSEK